MTFGEFFAEYSGPIVSALFLLGMFVEITPVKISPLQWIGRRVNKETLDKVSKIEKSQDELKHKMDTEEMNQMSVVNNLNNTAAAVCKIEEKLDEHIAQSYRTKIMNFQTSLIVNGEGSHTIEEWEEVIDACTKYETYVLENNLKNGKCKDAIRYIDATYQDCKRSKNFTNLK